MKKFSWKEFGSELLGGLMELSVELLIVLAVLVIGGFALWLIPDGWAEALNYDIELVGLIIAAIVLVFLFISKAIKEKKNEKEKYVVDKLQVDQEYIENQFQFLIDNGYNYKFYQKNWEKEFIYTLEECRIEVYLDGQAFDCVIKTKDFPRSNITQNPLAEEHFKKQFFKANTIERIDMVINLLRENADVFSIN